MPNILHGVSFPSDWNALQCQLYLFHFGNKLAAQPFWRPDGGIDPNPCDRPYVGGGRFEHSQLIDDLLWPKLYEHHDFSDKATEAFCENEQIAITGAGGTTKSTSTGCYALKFYLCAPLSTLVLIASTTIAASRKRIWKPISLLFYHLTQLAGTLDSVLLRSPTPRIVPYRSEQGKNVQDEGHGMHVVAMAEGEIEKAMNKVKGMHAERVLVVGDETDYPTMQGFINATANLRIGAKEFQAIWLGNDPSLLNPLGDLMQPQLGKPVTLEHKEWISAKGIKCLRFSGRDSPNVKQPGKWKGLIGQKDIDAIAKQYGEQSPQFWVMVEGLHPPEGADNTVLSESMFIRFNCRDSVIWRTGFTSCACLDPAFGGDRCTIRRFDYGLDKEGKMRILFHAPVLISINPSDTKTPAEYQISQKTEEFCKTNRVSPENFILDATGTGRGTAAVLQREWSPAIHTCEFGGAASSLTVSDENPIPAKDEYDRRITELYFAFREFVQADMVRGLDVETASEFCHRTFFIKGTGQGKRTAIQSKSELKAEGRPSPDLSDNAVLAVELLRRRGINASVVTEVKQNAADKFEEKVKELDWDAREDVYSDDFVLTPYDADWN